MYIPSSLAARLQRHYASIQLCFVSEFGRARDRTLPVRSNFMPVKLNHRQLGRSYRTTRVLQFAAGLKLWGRDSNFLSTCLIEPSPTVPDECLQELPSLRKASRSTFKTNVRFRVECSDTQLTGLWRSSRCRCTNICPNAHENVPDHRASSGYDLRTATIATASLGIGSSIDVFDVGLSYHEVPPHSLQSAGLASSCMDLWQESP